MGKDAFLITFEILLNMVEKRGESAGSASIYRKVWHRFH